MIYTFYSFKGGVGRSMALANVAELCYRRGLEVLIVDFDLEAPGLERYFDVPEAVHDAEEVIDKRGVIDLLVSYSQLRALPLPVSPRGTGSLIEPEPPFPVEPLNKFIVPIYEKTARSGSLSIIPAGQRGGDHFKEYADRLRSFDWDDFYATKEGERFFDWFREAAEDCADVVLIDSRTGVTEMSGVCTYQLADVVVMFVTPSQQNLDGTLMLAKSLSNPDLIQQRSGNRPLTLLFVPTRMDHTEGDKLNKFAELFSAELGGLIRSQTPRLKFEENIFDHLKIPYIAYYAYKEDVAVRHDHAVGSELRKAFANLAATLAQLEPPGGAFHRSYHPSTGELSIFTSYASETPADPFPESTLQASVRRVRIFISNKGDAEPDTEVAKEIAESLSHYHDVFVDNSIKLGQNWAEQLECELSEADYLVVLISANSIHSEMLQALITAAQRLATRRNGMPVIFPVRLAYRRPLIYPLNIYLDQLQFTLWQGPDDTARVIEEIHRAVSGGSLTKPELQMTDDTRQSGETTIPRPLPAAQPKHLEAPEGTMDPQSEFYVLRRSDEVALDAIARQGVTITIKGPRQMGKSSLLIRTIEAAVKAGKQAVFMDFQLIDRTHLLNADQFFRFLCAWLTNELGAEDRVDEAWKAPLGNTHRSTRYMSRLLKDLGRPLVIAMDEVEMVFEADFRSDFFGMLRSWHNSRGTSLIWKNLDIVLVTSTEPYQLIENLNQSPFNVGEVIELEDFTPEQVADLNRRHGSPLNSSDVRRLTALLGGHPYLVRRALYLVAVRRTTTEDLFANATSDHGPFGDHLRNQLFRLHNKEELLQGLREVIRYGTCKDELIFFRLRGAGLVRREGRTVLPRCQLYANYFREHLYG